MSHMSSNFPDDFWISTKVGLTRGASLPSSGLKSFAEAEMHYREQRFLADAKRHQAATTRSAARSNRNRRGLVSRWTTWLPSVRVHRSSAESQSSNVCGS